MKKKILPIIAAIAIIGIAAVWFLGSDLEHIEDTNGADNYTLQTITDENICNRDVFELNELTQTFLMEDVAGTVSLRIAGESADFMFDYYVY